jgi:hypothetical protein
MELKYNVTGDHRKQLVGAISQTLNAPTHYNGAPTFSYQVGDYTIDKVGTVIGPDSPELEETLRQRGFEAERVATPKRKGIMDTLVDALNENAGDDEHWERLHREPTIIDESGREHSLDGRFAPAADSKTAEESETVGTLTIEIPVKDFSDAALDNLTKLIDSKRELIKAALGHDTALQVVPVTDGKLSFEWFPYTEDGDEVAAYAAFVSLLCKTAKKKKRVTAKEREEITNPRFSFRVWLLSLGMIGDEYKTARKILLRNLPGNSSFASDQAKERWQAKHLTAKEGDAQ